MNECKHKYIQGYQLQEKERGNEFAYEREFTQIPFLFCEKCARIKEEKVELLKLTNV